jgi:hypothetical protein
MATALGDIRLSAFALVYWLLAQSLGHRDVFARDCPLLRVDVFAVLDTVRRVLRGLELGMLVKVLLLHPILPLRNLINY